MAGPGGDWDNLSGMCVCRVEPVQGLNKTTNFNAFIFTPELSRCHKARVKHTGHKPNSQNIYTHKTQL